MTVACPLATYAALGSADDCHSDNSVCTVRPYKGFSIPCTGIFDDYKCLLHIIIIIITVEPSLKDAPQRQTLAI